MSLVGPWKISNNNSNGRKSFFAVPFLLVYTEDYSLISELCFNSLSTP